jgi:hypothetical protein
MKRQMILSLIILFVSVLTSAAQTKPPVTDIRKVDFLNLTYTSTQCSQEYGKQGLGRLVNVRMANSKTRVPIFR